MEQRATNKIRKQCDECVGDEYHTGGFDFIWGVTSWDNLVGSTANFYTMNDIEICYNRESEMYSLDIETAYHFRDKAAEISYLEDLLKYFTEFMHQNDYDTDEEYVLDFSQLNITEANSIPELYTNFRLFVEGYKALYGGNRDE
jgi:hypothetical protein